MDNNSFSLDIFTEIDQHKLGITPSKTYFGSLILESE